MMTFMFLIFVLVAMALFFVLPPLLGRYKVSQTMHNELNLAIYQQRLKELEDDGEDDLSPEQKEIMRQELKKNLLQDMEEEEVSDISLKQRSGFVATLVGVSVPLLALGLYSAIGPDELSGIIAGDAVVPAETQNAHTGNQQLPDVAKMVEKLEQRLTEDPENAEGWQMLARSYMYMQRFNDATMAYEKAQALDKNNPQTLTDYAEALAMVRQGDMQGKPTELVLQALKIEPTHSKALWLAGAAKVQVQEYQAGINYWQRLMKMHEPNSEGANELQNRIDMAAKALRDSGGKPVLEKPAAKLKIKTIISVEVKLDPALAAKANPEDTLFIYAKAVNGPPMPLAIVRKQVKDLPLKVILDDSMAMTPRARLSGFERVYVGARISKAGSARAEAGDLQGRSSILTTGGKASAQVIIEQEID
ncbi:Cytochrome c heme lyase subunit CcmH [hydrothermal vent metagenome]|uniref:Cytochrome c heme lyase subunit CcmH n=1 Tax=hydrothermal vent metagenome TaxID=652676 RepID=A0A3B1AU87_9ZZZZ